MENLLQKYREIRTEYNALVEKNKDSLIYIDRSEDGRTIYGEGMYYKKSIYEKEKKKKQAFDRLESKSKLLLKQNNKEIFVVNYSGGKTIYVYDNDNIIEKTNISNDDSELQIENFVDNIYINHSAENNETEIYNLKQDNDGTRETTQYRKYKNDVLLLERNYENDFKISKEQMLKKLPDNFYESAIKVIDTENLTKKYFIDKDHVALSKEKIKNAIKNKDEYFVDMEITKWYNNEEIPIYRLHIPERSIGDFDNWQIDIDAKTNKVLFIKFSRSID